MSETLPNAEPIGATLPDPLEVGEPDAAGPLAVYPIFGPGPAVDYISFSAAHAEGQVMVTELAGSASVNDLAVENGGGRTVLLYEGEELLGAQQNRVLDVSLLIAAQAKTRIPVSCVEQGRWDGRRHREAFRPSRQAADPELRKLKQRRVRERAAQGAEPRADQAEVWDQVRERMGELETHSSTDAMSDLYERRRSNLDGLREPIGLHEGQCGAVCAIAGRISILDYVGRPDVWADLHPALLEGYAMDALRASRGESAPVDPPETSTVRGFTLLVTDAPISGRSTGPGLGESARFAAAGVAGSALVHERELVQLTAFPDGGWGGASAPPAPRASRARVSRPSRRRRRRAG